MDSEFIIQGQTDEIQKYLQAELAIIVKMKISKQAKIGLLEGFMAVVRQKQQIEREKIRENMSTSFSQNQSNFTAYEHQVEDLEEKILQKRVRKFQLNQEIQGIEEDLFQIQKTVDTKRDYDEILRRKIQKKMLEVEKAPEKQKPTDKSYLNKSIGAVSGMFKGWLY